MRSAKCTTSSPWAPRRRCKRSEEHTSELQSLTNLVCRLLLEHADLLHLHPFPTRRSSDLKHIPIATLDGMRERTITISGASKTFSVTGWRVGTIVAPPEATDAIRKVHDFLTVGAAAPLQEIGRAHV